MGSDNDGDDDNQGKVIWEKSYAGYVVKELRPVEVRLFRENLDQPI